MSSPLNRTDYFIAFGLPAKVVYSENQVHILTYEIDTGDLVPDRISWATLYHSHDDVESVSEAEFEQYVLNLRELRHLSQPQYFIIQKVPVKALPVDRGIPVVQRYNLETDAFDTWGSYPNLVGRSGMIGLVTQEDFEHTLSDIRAWYARLIPGWYIVSRQPVRMVCGDSGRITLLGYDAVHDRFIPSGWLWSSLLPPVDQRWVAEVTEAEFHRQVEEQRGNALIRWFLASQL